MSTSAQTATKTTVWFKAANWGGRGFYIKTDKGPMDMLSVVRAIRGRSVLDRERKVWVVFTPREVLVASLTAAGYEVRESLTP